MNKKLFKENQTVLICAGVAVLFLVFAFAPIPFAVPTRRAELAQQMKERYDHGNVIKGLAGETLTLPGLQAKGIPPQSWVDVRRSLIENINDQQKKVEAAARAGNARGRVEGKTPLLPIPNNNNADPARMTGTPMDGYLPKLVSGPMIFKASYGRQFPLWTALLAKGAMPTGPLADTEPDAAMPP